MEHNNLEQDITALDSPEEWHTLHEKIIQGHREASSEQEWVKFIELHSKLLDQVEKKLPQNIDIEKFKNLRLKEYNAMLLHECSIGGSFCAETLYEVTQRELEAGRMSPTHEFIEAAIQATADEHYSREQLMRQKEKIKDIDEHSVLNKFTRFLKNK